MGGTSTDVFLADAATGGPHSPRESVVAGVPVSVPMLDIHTAGAGGGSIARFDAGGLLRVGPESAGSDPGPICFGRGTSPPSPTPISCSAGSTPKASWAAPSRWTRPHARALRWPAEGPAADRRRVRRRHPARRRNADGEGHPRDLRRAWTRSAPVHAGRLRRRRPAARLRAGPRAAHPHGARSRVPGALSAVGILLADARARLLAHRHAARRRDRSSLARPSQNSKQRGLARVRAERTVIGSSAAVDLRYRGQGYELNVPVQPRMPPKHSTPAPAALWLLRPRAPARDREPAPAPGRRPEPFTRPAAQPYPGDGAQAAIAERGRSTSTAVARRHRSTVATAFTPAIAIPGPALITEYSSTTVLPPDGTLRVDSFGNLVIDIVYTERPAHERHAHRSHRTRRLPERHALHRRGDGRGPAAHRPLAQHQGAPRLLLRRLRRPGAA